MSTRAEEKEKRRQERIAVEMAERERAQVRVVDVELGSCPTGWPINNEILVDLSRKANGTPGYDRLFSQADALWAVAAANALSSALDATAEKADDALNALADLVRLKDGPRDDAYRAKKDEAWAAARKVLSDG